MAIAVKGPTNMLLAAQLGQHGTYTITDTALHERAGGWIAIQIIAEAVFNVLTDAAEEAGGNSNLTGVTYLVNTTIYGLFTAIDLTSGKVRCYSSPQQA